MKEHKINDQIDSETVFLVDDQGKGKILLEDGIKLAYMKGVDLVQMSEGNDGIPVCKILDYSKYKFEQSKKQRDIKKKQRETRVITKELQMRPATDDNDIKIKASKANKFLKKGHKVRVIVSFKGRETAHPDIGKNVLNKFLLECESYDVDQEMITSGKSVILTIKPKVV